MTEKKIAKKYLAKGKYLSKAGEGKRLNVRCQNVEIRLLIKTWGDAECLPIFDTLGSSLSFQKEKYITEYLSTSLSSLTLNIWQILLAHRKIKLVANRNKNKNKQIKKVQKRFFSFFIGN